jgi:hypothetical protein
MKTRHSWEQAPLKPREKVHSNHTTLEHVKKVVDFFLRVFSGFLT